MNGYKIYTSDEIGYEIDTKYTVSYNKAIQIFNDKIRKAVYDCGLDIISREDFGDEIASIRERIQTKSSYSSDEGKMICRAYPILIMKYENSLVASIFYWYKCSYEYSEYDITSSNIVLEEIEIVD